LDDNNKKSYVLKTDSLGNLQWSQKYSTSFNEWCFSIRTVDESKYVMCGMSDSLHLSFERAFVRLIDNNGNRLSEKFYRGGGGEIQNAFYSVEPVSDKGYVLSGFTYVGSGLGYVVKTDSMLNVIPVGVFGNYNTELPNYFELYQNYPNPFNSTTTIKYNVKRKEHIRLSIYDISGKQICALIDEIKNPGMYEVVFSASSYFLASGVYYYQLSKNGNNEQFLTKKFLYIK
jgi:hypothetical protein